MKPDVNGKPQFGQTRIPNVKGEFLPSEGRGCYANCFFSTKISGIRRPLLPDQTISWVPKIAPPPITRLSKLGVCLSDMGTKIGRCFSFLADKTKAQQRRLERVLTETQSRIDETDQDALAVQKLTRKLEEANSKLLERLKGLSQEDRLKIMQQMGMQAEGVIHEVETDFAYPTSVRKPKERIEFLVDESARRQMIHDGKHAETSELVAQAHRQLEMTYRMIEECERLQQQSLGGRI